VSDHPVLKASSWRVSVLILTERRIDRRCPHSDRRIIRCYCLRCSSSATRPTLLEIGLSVHLTVPRVSPSEPTRPTIAPTLAIWVPSVHPTVYFLLLSSSVLTLDFLILACDILASLGPRSVYKDMLNNKISPIDHVVMNHQIKLELMAYEAMFATEPFVCAHVEHCCFDSPPADGIAGLQSRCPLVSLHGVLGSVVAIAHLRVSLHGVLGSAVTIAHLRSASSTSSTLRRWSPERFPMSYCFPPSLVYLILTYLYSC
jgi:hypothetical protein